MIRYNGINHLAMVTNDIDMTIRFWRDLLGMRLVAGLGGGGRRHYFFEIGENDFIAFFEWPEAEPVPEKDHGYPVAGPVVFDHVSFGVESEENLWELKEKLEAAGFPVSGVIDHGFIHSIYSFDPNGIPIEFSASVTGIDVRKNPVMADRNPSAEALLGSEPVDGAWPPVKEKTPPYRRKVYEGAGARFDWSGASTPPGK